MAFRPGIVDLPEGYKEANVNAITLPEVFHDFDTALPELNDIDIEAQFSINQSRADEITMREDYGSLSLSLHDEGFGDIGFEGDTPDVVRGALDSSINEQIFENEEGRFIQTTNTSDFLNDVDQVSKRLDGDNFPDDLDQPELFEGDLFADPHVEKTEGKPGSPHSKTGESFNCDMGLFASGDPLSPASSHASFIETADKINGSSIDAETILSDRKEPLRINEGPSRELVTDLPPKISSMLQNEDESFALAPIDTSQYRGSVKNRRKRKLIVDEIKNISGEEMKAQLANTCDIVTTLDLAPPTKRLMYWKETGGVEKLFSLSSRHISASAMFDYYQRHLTSHSTLIEDFVSLGPSDLFALDQIQLEHEFSLLSPKKNLRKRKQEGKLISIHKNDKSINLIQSSSSCDHMRDLKSVSLPQASLDIASVSHESEPQMNNENLFDKIRSPRPLFSANDVTSDVPFTPGNLNHGNDDDYNRRSVTPVEFHHGRLTPEHTTIGNITPLPSLSCDRVSYILNSPRNDFKNDCQITNATPNIAPDWNDFGPPVAMHVQNACEEQMEHETDQQFEERVLNKRAAQLFYAIKTRISKPDALCLSELTVQNFRKQAAQKFYSLLVLKKFRALDIIQTTPYGEINVFRGVMFDNPKL